MGLSQKAGLVIAGLDPAIYNYLFYKMTVGFHCIR